MELGYGPTAYYVTIVFLLQVLSAWGIPVIGETNLILLENLN